MCHMSLGVAKCSIWEVSVTEGDCESLGRDIIVTGEYTRIFQTVSEPVFEWKYAKWVLKYMHKTDWHESRA